MTLWNKVDHVRLLSTDWKSK